MTKTNLLLDVSSVITTALLLSGCISGTELDTAADTAAINAIWSDYESAMEAGDLERWLSLWTSDGVQMPPGEPAIEGTSRIRERNGAALELFSVDMDISAEEAQVVDDWAFSRGTYSATFSPKSGEDPMLVDGKFLTIFLRQSDGGWKIHRDMFNSNIPPEGN